jgi:large subunit ribosomal protein L15
VKILAKGEVTKALTVHAHAFSGSARAAIEAAGGTCNVVE